MKKNMKKFISILLVVSTVLTTVFVPLCSFADTSLRTEYKEALAEEETAKAEYDKAKAALQLALVDFNKGSYGFYEWLYETQDGWIREDAKDAMDLLNKTAFKKYVQMGKKGDATDLNEMKYALSLLPELQELRDNDENIKDLPPVTIRSIFMARAQVNADSSSKVLDHMPEDTGYDKDITLENLAWDINDPFILWYHVEKEYYNKARKYIMNKYGYDINIDEEYDQFEKMCRETGENNMVTNTLYRFGDYGHYEGCMTGKVRVLRVIDGTYYHYTAKAAMFGIATGKGKGGSSYCSCLTFDSMDHFKESMTIKEYTDLFNEYYKMVSAPEEKKAYEDAKEEYDLAKKNRSKAETALKKALKTKASVSRRKNKITVKISKNTSCTGYQVSVSSNKKSWKTTNTKSLKKTIKSKGKKYIKVRAYTKVNGKTIYGAWTKTVRK